MCRDCPRKPPATLPPPHSPSPAHKRTAVVGVTRALLSVDRRHLNVDAEIRRMFGAGATRDGGHRGGGGPPRRGATLYRKTVLAAAKDTWPRFTKIGLQMARDTDADRTDGGGGGDGFTFVHSKDYQKVQLSF